MKKVVLAAVLALASAGTLATGNGNGHNKCTGGHANHGHCALEDYVHDRYTDDEAREAVGEHTEAYDDTQLQTRTNVNSSRIASLWTGKQDKLTEEQIAAFLEKTVDTDTQLSDEYVLELVGEHTVDTDTQLSDSDISDMGYIKEDTDTIYDDSDVKASIVAVEQDSKQRDAENLAEAKVYADANDANTMRTDAEIDAVAELSDEEKVAYLKDNDTIYDDTAVRQGISGNASRIRTNSKVLATKASVSSVERVNGKVDTNTSLITEGLSTASQERSTLSNRIAGNGEGIAENSGRIDTNVKAISSNQNYINYNSSRIAVNSVTAAENSRQHTVATSERVAMRNDISNLTSSVYGLQGDLSNTNRRIDSLECDLADGLSAASIQFLEGFSVGGAITSTSSCTGKAIGIGYVKSDKLVTLTSNGDSLVTLSFTAKIK